MHREPDELDRKTVDALRRAYRRDVPVPDGLDRAIVARGVASIRRASMLRRWRRIGTAAAAVVALGIVSTSFRSGREPVAPQAPAPSYGDIRDAFALARAGGDRAEVDRLAALAVRLPEVSR